MTATEALQMELLTKALMIIADPANYGHAPNTIPVKVVAIVQAVLAQLKRGLSHD